MFVRLARASLALTSFAEASPARTSASPEPERGSTVIGLASGLSTCGSFAHFDPGSSSWKTYQLSLLEGSESYSEAWPRAGTTLSGIAFPQPPSAPLTAVTGSSWSRGESPTPSAIPYGSSQARTWATPIASDGRAKGTTGRVGRGQSGASLAGMARHWPTPTAGDEKRSGSRAPPRRPGNSAHDGTSLTDATCRTPGRPHPTTCTHGGECRWRLNPRFVEWLMGFPPDWTDVD